MEKNQNQLNPNDFWSMATKAVASFTHNRYQGMFTAEDLEDIVATVVCKMWEARESFDPAKGRVFSWVWRIAQNTILDTVDAKAKRLGISNHFEKVNGGVHVLPIPEYSADDQLICEDKVEYYLSELKSERDKRYLLYLVDGLDADEIAQRENIPVQNVYTVVFRLRQRLRKLAG